MDSSTFKRFTASVDNIIESLEDADFSGAGKHEMQFPKLLMFIQVVSLKNINIITLCPHADDDEIPEELLLGKHQLGELGSDSSKIKAMGIFNKVREVHCHLGTIIFTIDTYIYNLSKSINSQLHRC